MVVRSKDESQNKAGLRQSSFAFRRIQSRELYQPSHESQANRLRFRIRVQLLSRTQ
jgi:hypothetical protein